MRRIGKNEYGAKGRKAPCAECVLFGRGYKGGARARMNPGAFRILDDQELLDAAARLEQTVDELAEARTEIGLRVKLNYAEALTAARVELARRRV